MLLALVKRAAACRRVPPRAAACRRVPPRRCSPLHDCGEKSIMGPIGNSLLDGPARPSVPRKRESGGWIPASAGGSPRRPGAPTRQSSRRPGESRGLGERCPLDSGLRRNDEGGPFDLSPLRPFDTLRPFAPSTPFALSTPFDLSAFRPFGLSPLRPFAPSTPFVPSSLRPFVPSTLRPFDPSTGSGHRRLRDQDRGTAGSGTFSVLVGRRGLPARFRQTTLRGLVRSWRPAWSRLRGMDAPGGGGRDARRPEGGTPPTFPGTRRGTRTESA